MFKYEPKPIAKLRTDFSRRKSDKKNSFKNIDDFLDWYKKADKVCHYCGLKEEESQYLVHNGILRSKRFPLNGRFARGRGRGYWLEVDRKIPTENYSPENCVLSCYFCNNDKSDIFTKEQYLLFQKDRLGYLRKLIDSNK